MKHASEMNKYVQMGMAAMIPGMQHAIEIMQQHLDQMRQALKLAQEREAAPVEEPAGRRTGRGSSWEGMTAEERSIEMKRRQAKARRAGGAKTRWENMTKKQRAEWQAKMMAGRRKAKKQADLPTAHLAASQVNGRAVA